ncbi:hypothetical protein ACO2JO_04820 [Leptospira interrogans]
MPELTRRPHPERSDCWHVYYGDVQVGTIAIQSGLLVKAKQWRWDVGFYPASHRGRSRSGYAPSFEEARASLSLGKTISRGAPRTTLSNIAASEPGRLGNTPCMPLACCCRCNQPVGRARCFCGVTIDMAVTDRHVQDAYGFAARMKFSTDRPYSDPEKAARKLLDITNATEPVDGKIYIEKINALMLYQERATPAEYKAGLDLAISRGWLLLHESGTFVKFTPAGAEMFA